MVLRERVGSCCFHLLENILFLNQQRDRVDRWVAGGRWKVEVEEEREERVGGNIGLENKIF